MDDTVDGNVEVRAPPGFMDGVPEVNEVSDLRVKFVKYVASPFVNDTLDSPVLDFSILSELADALPLSTPS